MFCELQNHITYGYWLWHTLLPRNNCLDSDMGEWDPQNGLREAVTERAQAGRYATNAEKTSIWEVGRRPPSIPHSNIS